MMQQWQSTKPKHFNHHPSGNRHQAQGTRTNSSFGNSSHKIHKECSMGKACIQEWCRGKAWDQEHLTQPKAIHLANSTKGKGKVVHHKDNHQPKSVSHYIAHQAMHMARHYQTSHHLAMDFAHQWGSNHSSQQNF